MESLPPDNPETENTRGSWFLFAITIFVLVTGWAIGLMLFTPFFVLIGVVFALIGVQYLVWGYWFERYFKNNPPPNSSEADQTREP
jgi:hypothetical protein